jgi:predicted lipid-binding transport protein (Tim44 family)
MNEYQNDRLLGYQGRTGGWLQRILLALLGLVILVAGFFFLTVALVAGAFLALAIGVRIWWTLRRLRKQAQASAALEGEYTVVERAEAERHRR